MVKREVWVDIVGYEGYYQVSNLGRVKSLDRYIVGKAGIKRIKPGVIKSLCASSDGYYNMQLSKNSINKTISVHRLVAIHFIPNPDNKPQVNHINSVRTDNRVENLEWVTIRENSLHGYHHGNKEICIKSANIKTRKKVERYSITGEKLSEHESTADAARAIGCHQTQIAVACMAARGTHYSNGYLWKYMGGIFTGRMAPSRKGRLTKAL